MADEIMATSRALETSLVSLMQPLDGGQVPIQEEHASNRTQVSPTPSTSAAETVAAYIASLWCQTVNPPLQASIETTNPQIVVTQQTEIPVS